MPPEENDAMRDVPGDQAQGNDACNDSTEHETTSQEVGTSTRNIASEDGDTGASLSVGTQGAADEALTLLASLTASSAAIGI